MSPLLDIPPRPSEAKDQKLAQPVFRSRQIIGRIHLAQQVISRHLPVKCRHQAAETVFTNECKNILIVHV